MYARAYNPGNTAFSRRALLLFLFFLLMLPAQAQVYRYRLQLDGKPDSRLCAFTQRSEQRRQRQGIAIDSTDYEVSPHYIESLQQAGLHIWTRSRWLNTVVVSGADNTAIDTAFWQQFPFVTHIDTVSTTEIVAKSSVRTTEEMLSHTQETGNLYDNFREPMREIKGDVLYAAGYRGQGMLVVVIDGGFENVDDYSWLSSRVVGCRDMFRPASDSLMLYNESAHGAHCLSVMASDSARGVWGAAPEADYYLIRTECVQSETPYEEDLWIAAVEYADSLGADLINSSLGYYHFDNGYGNHSHSELGTGKVHTSRAANIGSSKGMVICMSAGNERANPWQRVIFPSEAEGILTVGATGFSLEPTYFSSTGFTTPYVKPDVACRGLSTYVINTLTGLAMRGSGTSYASPLICGLCASLWQAAPSLTSRQIMDVVRQSSSQYASPDSLMGYGMPDFSIALTEAQRLHDTGLKDQPSAPESSPHRYYDILGRPLLGRPSAGCYIEQGKLRIVLHR